MYARSLIVDRVVDRSEPCSLPLDMDTWWNGKNLGRRITRTLEERDYTRGRNYTAGLLEIRLHESGSFQNVIKLFPNVANEAGA
jgi:hypothetical protein